MPATTNVLRPRGFTGHWLGAGTGAAIDNLVRLAFIAALPVALADGLGALLSLAFIVPFLLVAPTAGSLGDRLPRHRIMRWCRLAEYPLLLLSCLGLAWIGTGGQVSNLGLGLMILTLALSGLQSAFYGPVKYASIGQLVGETQLEPANGVMQAVTSAGILLGTALVFLLDPQMGLLDLPLWDSWSDLAVKSLLMGSIGAVLVTVGLIATWSIPPLPAADPQRRIDGPWALVGQLRAIGEQPGIWAPLLGLAGFWALGATAQLGAAQLAKQAFGLGEMGVAGFAMVMGVGIGIGALRAHRVSAPAFPIALPLLGALVTSGGCLLAGVAATLPNLSLSLLGLLLAGIGGGWWTVSLNTLIQQRSAPSRRATVYAGVDIVTNLGMIVAFGLLVGLAQIDIGNVEALIWIGLVGLAVVTALCWRQRIELVGWFATRLVHLIYRVEIHGLRHLPAGGCILAPNHNSYADGIVLSAVLPRRTMSLVFASYLRAPIIGTLLRAGGCEPIDGEGARAALVAVIKQATAAASDGRAVLVFPEGKLSRSGQIDTFQRGIEKIAERAQVPIVPIHISGLEDSRLSLHPARCLRWRRRVVVRLGAPLPAGTSAAAVRAAVVELSADTALADQRHDRRTLGRSALAQARCHPRAVVVEDQGGRLKRLTHAAVAVQLARHLGEARGERIGILLPPGRGGAVANLAVALAGGTAVNLNHTTGAAGLDRMVALAGIRRCISAQLYLDKAGAAVPAACQTILLERVLPALPRWRTLLAMLRVLCWPWGLDRARPGEAALVFSSGTTGDPKGVPLSHAGILANVQAAYAHFGLVAGDARLLSPLPLFHSFGLTVGLWLGLLRRVELLSHPDPRDGAALGRLAERCRPTFAVGTATFVRGWMRRIEPAQFKSVRFVVVGAEKCPADLALAFQERYGVPLLEGYGCTELGPVVASNRVDEARSDLREICQRPGSVGRPLGGVAVRAVDPETLATLPVDSEGLLVVRSPARMAGYLDREDLTAKALLGEAYRTGDMGRVDADGFIHITGRLARFAKIGGEMVPLDRVEELLSSRLDPAWRGDGVELAVTAVPDATKGERLLVLHTGLTCTSEQLLALLEDQPAIFRPRSADVHRVDTIPVLGTGKRDLRALAELGRQLVA